MKTHGRWLWLLAAAAISCSLFVDLNEKDQSAAVNEAGAGPVGSSSGSSSGGTAGGMDAGSTADADGTAPMPASCGPNLLENGGFESGANGWRGFGFSGLEFPEAAAAHSGLLGMRMCVIKGFGATPYSGYASREPAVTTAGEVVLRAWFRTRSDGGTNSANMVMTSGSFPTLDAGTGALGGQWKCVTVRGVSLPNSVTVGVSAPEGQCIDVDDVELYRLPDDAGAVNCLCPQ